MTVQRTSRSLAAVVAATALGVGAAACSDDEDHVIDRDDGALTAEIDGRRVPLMSLDYARTCVAEESDTLVLPAATAA